MATTGHQTRQPIPTTALATQATPNTTLGRWGMDRDQLDLLKRTLARGLTDDEFALFMNTAQRMGLDPFAKQIYAIKRRSKDHPDGVMAIQVGIDGYRASAHRTGEYDGQEGPFWCGEDGVWRDVWISDQVPAAAKVIVHRKGCAHPFVGIATFRSYVQDTPLWRKGADYMLAKCAEAVAHRKAFPSELGGTHTPDEVDQDADLAAVTMQKLPDVAVVKSPPTAAKPANTDQASAPPAQQPAKPAAPEQPEMTDDEANTIEKEIMACKDIPSMKVVFAKKIAPRKMPQAIRTRLETAYKDHVTLIKEAAQAERDAAGPEGGPQS